MCQSHAVRQRTFATTEPGWQSCNARTAGGPVAADMSTPSAAITTDVTIHPIFWEKSMGHHGDHPAPCSWLAPLEGVFGEKELLSLDSRPITSFRAQPACRSRSAVRRSWGYVWGYLQVSDVANHCQLWVSWGSLIVLLPPKITSEVVRDCPKAPQPKGSRGFLFLTKSNRLHRLQREMSRTRLAPTPETPPYPNASTARCREAAARRSAGYIRD